MIDSRIKKFEILVKRINECLQVYDKGFWTSPLEMIFNRHELNEYANIIIQTASFTLTNGVFNLWAPFVIEEFDNEDKRLKAVEQFVDICCNECSSRNYKEGYKLLFWSLMILTVDNKESDYKLSLICDFARMLKITDEELIDMAKVLKYIYHELDDKYEFKSERTREIFSNLLNIYMN